MSNYKNDKPWVDNEYLIQCDLCGIKRYSCEMRKRWDGFWCCIPGNCWDPKDPIFWIPPVINDPHTIVDIRPQLYFINPSIFNYVQLIWNVNDYVIDGNPYTMTTWNATNILWNNVPPIPHLDLPI